MKDSIKVNNPKELATNSDKLNALADWFDAYDEKHDIPPSSNAVQVTLRKVADKLNKLKKNNKRLKKELKEAIQNSYK